MLCVYNTHICVMINVANDRNKWTYQRAQHRHIGIRNKLTERMNTSTECQTSKKYKTKTIINPVSQSKLCVAAAHAVVSESISHCHHYSHHNQQTLIEQRSQAVRTTNCFQTLSTHDFVAWESCATYLRRDSWLTSLSLLPYGSWNTCIIMVQTVVLSLFVCTRQHNLMAIFSDWIWVWAVVVPYKVIYGYGRQEANKKLSSSELLLLLLGLLCAVLCVLWSILVFFYDYWLLEWS